ncbi:MAG: sulfotransferase domain-containing protein [Roseovarius sp.]|nr:sulfotransferase domain-containing protein [Roseovarius sp.]
MRYEDLLEDTGEELRTLARNFGWHIEDEVITQAVEASSRNAMRRQEASARKRSPATIGIRVQGQSSMVPASVEHRIEQDCRNECRLLGYDA